MRFERLEISFLRNLSSVAIDLAPGLNYFHGDNGAGKTALLEAVHLLCRGRSFRTSNARSLIQDGADQLVVRGVVEDEHRGRIVLAISKDRNARTELKIDGRAERRLSEVARLTPLQVMLPDISDLVFGGPSLRRSWLDWGTFHVKPEFLDRLRDYLRAMRQRNALLKGGAASQELEPWSQKVAQLGQWVGDARRSYLDEFTPHFDNAMAALAPELDIELHYRQGWSDADPLEKLLGQSLPREVKYGATLWGPHRADVQIRAARVPASGVLSRGQGKMVASAMHIAQAALLALKDRRRTVFLIDDAGAELDVTHNERFFELLEQIGGQILATTTRRPAAEGAAASFIAPRETSRPGANVESGDTQVFHVEQGVVRGE